MQKEFSNDCTETMNRFVIIGMYYVLFACQNNNKSVYNLPMKTLEVCIIDDNPEDLKKEKDMISRSLHSYSPVFTCSHSFETISDISRYDVFFLDIDLPEEDGIHLAEKIHDEIPDKPVIFVSSHNELVFSSLRVSPAFFIRKDHLSEDTEQAVFILEKRLREKPAVFDIQYNGTFVQIPLSDIRWFRKDHNELYIFDGRNEYRIRKPLKDALSEISGYPMMQISESAAVNPNHISYIQDDRVVFEERDFHISRRFLTTVRKKYAMWMKVEL